MVGIEDIQRWFSQYISDDGIDGIYFEMVQTLYIWRWNRRYISGDGIEVIHLDIVYIVFNRWYLSVLVLYGWDLSKLATPKLIGKDKLYNSNLQPQENALLNSFCSTEIIILTRITFYLDAFLPIEPADSNKTEAAHEREPSRGFYIESG